MQRCEVFYSGRVQGVGFRYTARRLTAGFVVTGFVQNLPDGRVWLVAEGSAAELDAFLAAIADELDRHIHSVEQTRLEASGEFADFGVRFQDFGGP